MSIERPIGQGAEPPPLPPSAGAQSAGDQPATAVRLQILSTEHWSLLASRALAWNESFTRAGMFLTTLTGAIVALALVAQADEFGEGFRLFALVILPVVLIIGIGTNLRMGMSNYHDALCVTGMNRIRAGYLEIAPDLERFFVMGTTDDQRGILLTMAMPPRTSLVVGMLASTPALVSMLNSILVGAILALLSIQLGVAIGPTIVIAVAGFIASLAAWSWYGAREIGKVRNDRTQPRFPTRDDG
jgi:hypothetical protein